MFSQTLCLLLLSASLLFSFFPPFGNSLFFNYSDFLANATSGTCSPDASIICLVGDASVDNQSGVLHLTGHSADEPNYYSSGRAFYSQPLFLWNNATGAVTDFVTNFSFDMTSNLNNIGDGIAFLLSYYPSKLPESSNQSNMGLVTPTHRTNATGNARFVAVEFDTYMNDIDPSSSHIGINVNSIKSAAYKNLTGLGFRAFDTGKAQVRYDSKTTNLNVSLDYNGTQYALSHQVNLPNIFPEWVAVGFSASTGGGAQLNKILSWSFESTLKNSTSFINPNTDFSDSPTEKKKGIDVAAIVTGACVSVAVILALLCFLLWYSCRKSTVHASLQKGQDHGFMGDDFEKTAGPRRFTFDSLSTATDGFSDERRLGAGGFGAVYRGFLRDLNREVAIKRMSRHSSHGRKAYAAEVKIISSLRHRNLVQLLGWCHEKAGDFLLVYEFLGEGSLDHHLFHADPVLPWPVRYNVALDVASALLYLHEEWEQCVVHRDIKSSNVMLDDAFNAKLGDFGLARMTDHGSGLQTTLLAGTIAYMAPEVLATSRASKESDVYSFGILALEIACGRRAIEPDEKVEKLRLVEWVWDLYRKGTILEAADGKLEKEFDELQMERLIVVGLWCANPERLYRPSIGHALAALKFESGTVELPRDMAVPNFGEYDLSYLQSSLYANSPNVPTSDSRDSQVQRPD